MRTVDHRFAEQLPAVPGAEMLHIEAVGVHQMPGTIGDKMQRPGGHVISWSAIRKERQRKERLGTVEEEQMAVPLDGGIRPQPRERRWFCERGNQRAAPVGTVAPV